MGEILLDAFLVLLTIFFGAMALYPLFTTKVDTDLEPELFQGGEDRIISVVPTDLCRETPIPLIKE